MDYYVFIYVKFGRVFYFRSMYCDICQMKHLRQSHKINFFLLFNWDLNPAHGLTVLPKFLCGESR